MGSFFILLLACCYSLCVLPAGVISHKDLILDQTVDPNPILYEKVHERVFKIGDIINKECVDLEFEGMVITSVRVTDRWRDGTGGKVQLKSGGIGHSSVEIVLKGRLLRGYSFDVVIRGKPISTTTITPIPYDIDIRIDNE